MYLKVRKIIAAQTAISFYPQSNNVFFHFVAQQNLATGPADHNLKYEKAVVLLVSKYHFSDK